MQGLRLGIATEEEIVKLLKAGELKQREIGEKFGISQTVVSMVGIRNGVRRFFRGDAGQQKRSHHQRSLAEEQAEMKARQAQAFTPTVIAPRVPFKSRLSSGMLARKEEAIKAYEEVRSLAGVARVMGISTATVRKLCEGVELPPLPLPPPPPPRIHFPEKKVSAEILPVFRPERLTPEEIAEREYEDRMAREAVEAEARALREAKPDGTKCRGDNACPFPAMVNGMCRRHFRESKALFSISPSSSSYTIAQGDKFGA